MSAFCSADVWASEVSWISAQNHFLPHSKSKFPCAKQVVSVWPTTAVGNTARSRRFHDLLPYAAALAEPRMLYICFLVLLKLNTFIEILLKTSNIICIHNEFSYTVIVFKMLFSVCKSFYWTICKGVSFVIQQVSSIAFHFKTDAGLSVRNIESTSTMFCTLSLSVQIKWLSEQNYIFSEFKVGYMQ